MAEFDQGVHANEAMASRVHLEFIAASLLGTKQWHDPFRAWVKQSSIIDELLPQIIP